MQSLLDLIEAFSLNIYLNMPSKINEDFVAICEAFSAEIDRGYGKDEEVLSWKNGVLGQLFQVLQTNDFIKMADFLEYQLKPVLVSKFMEQESLTSLQ